ncbi:hypothetical protein FDUTEX481_05791 [Tolypothrix sp. PCC 7601]|nr:hypothetical protein FDUTEX481_05791 [Tolypothrix sp. PCC 7601]
MGIGHWALGIASWVFGIWYCLPHPPHLPHLPNPQSLILSPQSPIPSSQSPILICLFSENCNGEI